MDKNIENKNERTEKIINHIKKNSKEFFNNNKQKNDFETKEFESKVQEDNNNYSQEEEKMYEAAPESDGEEF